MRRSPLEFRRSATVMLVLINVVAFVLQQLLMSRYPDFLYYSALSLDGLRHGFVWQLLSFQFLHASVTHLLSNCLAIYFLGRAVEEAVGRWPFVVLYFVSGVMGGLFQALTGLVLTLAGSSLGVIFAGPVIGASAGAFGVAAAFAMLFPESLLLLFFIVPIRAKYLLVLEGLIAVLGMFGVLLPGLAHAAHLGGMLTGMFFVRYAIHWHWEWPQLRRPRPQPPRRLVRVSTGSSALWNRNRDTAVEDLPPEEFLSKEVDPILDKISAHGIHSLTERERRILEAAREKMGKR